MLLEHEKKMKGGVRNRLERYPLWSICHHEYKRRIKNNDYKCDGYPVSYEGYLKVRMQELIEERNNGSDNR